MCQMTRVTAAVSSFKEGKQRPDVLSTLGINRSLVDSRQDCSKHEVTFLIRIRAAFQL